MTPPEPARLSVVPGPNEATDFDTVYRRYAPYAAAIAYRLMGRTSEVEDLVQDVFVDVHEGLPKLRHPGALKGWIATITVRKAKRRLKWLAARRMLGLGEVEVDAVLVDPGAGPEANAHMQQIFRRLEVAPVDERVAWILRHLEGLTLEEVAAAVGCSLATAKRRLRRARAHLDEVFHDG